MSDDRYSEIRDLVLEIIDDKIDSAGLSKAHFSDTDNLFDSGILDSFEFLDMIIALEEKTGLRIELADMEADQISTLRGFVNGLLKAGA